MDKVKDTLAKIGDFVKTKFSSLSKKTIIIASAAVAVVVVSLIILIAINGQTHYAVLYSEASASEAQEICTYARETLGVTDIKISGNGDVLVPDNQVEELRVSMSIAGYPKSTFNYDTWKNGVSLFSTKTELRQLEKQQLQDNLMATLRYFTNVDNAIVIIGLPETEDYVLSESEKELTASVALTVRNTLTAEQIDGMYNLVATSVPGLSRANITITDQSGAQLSPEFSTSYAQQEEERLQILYQRLSYRDRYRETLESTIETLLKDSFDGVNVAVGLDLDFNNEVEEQTFYSGANVDENGNQSGIVSDETIKNASGGQGVEGGVPGTTTNADISPDYPTITLGENGEYYYEYSRQINYKVNEVKRQIEKDKGRVSNISAAVVVKSNAAFTNDEETRWRRLIANAIGAQMEDVSIEATPFIETTNPIFSETNVNIGNINSESMVLIAVIIILGVVLIILLILALRAPGARKKRRPVNRLVAVPAAAGAGAEGGGGIGAQDDEYQNIVKIDDSEFELTSLSEEQPETRDEALKREIQDFSKNNPEIVAQLIRSWIRGED